LKWFRNGPRNSTASRRTLPAALAAVGVCGLAVAGWQARAALPRWMQDAVSGSAIEAALYRVMKLPGATSLYPRPPKEAQSELNALIGKAPQEAQLYSLRAMEEEQGLDFRAAEADWKAYTGHANDKIAAKIELADYYHRRLQAANEVQTLMEVGAAPAQPAERYTAPAAQRSWQAFERVLPLAADQGLDDDVVAKTYAAWIARYPEQASLYARELKWLLDGKKFDKASALVAQYRRASPQDAVFPLKATALIEFRRGSIDAALKTCDAGFEPLWPAELVESYYALLAQTHNQRRFLADARARLAQNPDDLNALARLFYYAQQQGNLQNAQQVMEAYRVSKESRKAQWTAQELYVLAQWMEAIHAYPEAARYDFALYHSQGTLTNGASAQETGLGGIVRVLLTAPEQQVELGAGNLSMYRDLATLDRGPGYWNGILSLWLNSDSPDREYNEEERRAQPYFHRAKAAQLLALLDKEYPKAAVRAELHKELIQALAGYGESSLVVKAGGEFLQGFTTPADETDRVLVAMDMAAAYARQQDTKDEFALYDRMLTELSAQTDGMPLTAARVANQGSVVMSAPAANTRSDDGENAEGGAQPSNVAKARAFDISVTAPGAAAVPGSLEYQQMLERYLGRLTSTGKLPEALAVLRRELDRNPNDPLLYERLATFLQQNNLSAQEEEVYNQAIGKFQDKSWYDKLARLYLREKKQAAFAELTKKVTVIFSGTELEAYFSQVRNGGPQLFLQLNLYAHQRFPHNLVFVQNLLTAYSSRETHDSVAWEAMLREHWSDSEALRAEFFDYLRRNNKLDAELARLRELVPGATEQRENSAAARELAEAQMWRSHFEESAPLMGALAEAYPADVEIGTQASDLYRSLAYFDTAQTSRAVKIEERLLAANPAETERLARIGDILADSGADGTPGHENIVAAAVYWRRMPRVHPGTSDGYLQAATVFWDYFQFDDAQAEISAARQKFGLPSLYGYEAGAIEEGKRDFAKAIHEYTAAACAGDGNEQAAMRLLQLARRKATAKMVDDETVRSLEGGGITALQLRVRVLKVQKRIAEIGPLLEAAIGRAATFEQAQAIGVAAQANALTQTYELALKREMALATDPVQKIEISYELARSLEGRRNIDEASRVIDETYHDNPKLLGVVRATTDFDWRNEHKDKAIATLIEAAKTAESAQPQLSRQLVVEAADKANQAGHYDQARSLMAPLLAPESDAYNPQYVAVVADSYARAGDDAGLKQFYLAKLSSIRSTPATTMSVAEHKQKTVLLRRGLIPALTRMKDYAGAVDQYIAILSDYPEDADTAREIALYALRYERKQQLLEFASRTVKASPKDSRFAILLAQIQTAFADYPAAIDAYAHAIAIRSDRADLYAAKADLEERLQRLDDACKEYERLYVLTYKNPDWMVKEAEARARQGRGGDAVKALERAWIEGHPPTAENYFRVARQLESWSMLEDGLRFAELGVKAEGDDLLGGSAPGNQNGDDAEGAVVYLRLMTRLRKYEAGLAALDAARKAAEVSTNSPSVVVEQVEKHGLASVTDSEWRKRRAEQRDQTAQQRFERSVMEMGRTAEAYFSPEEKQSFARLVDARFSAEHLNSETGQDGRSKWIAVSAAAGIKDEEAKLRSEVLLEESTALGAQFNPLVQLQRSRMQYAELVKTLEAYAPKLNQLNRGPVRLAQIEALRDMGDEPGELRMLRQTIVETGDAGGLHERYLQLLLKLEPARFASSGASSRDDAANLAAPNYAVVHSDLQMTRTTLTARQKTYGTLWEQAYSALAGLYFRDSGEGTENAFHAVLGDESTIGQRMDAAQNHGQRSGLTGGIWFYYGMRYGVYRTLAPEKERVARDPEDMLAAGIEGNSSAGHYAGLAQAYADAGNGQAALAEYRHVLELAPDSPAVRDAMALLEWQAGRHEAAVADWREALAALNRIQDKGAAPESFWSDFARIAEHASAHRVAAQLHSDMDTVLRTYLGRNGDYRSDELLKAAFNASANHTEGVQWLLALSGAANDPATVLASIDGARWLPEDVREPVLLREIELARIAAQHAPVQEAYSSWQIDRLVQTLITYYVAAKQDEKAQAMLGRLTVEQRRNDVIRLAQIELAARAHTLDVLLTSYRTDPASLLGSDGAQQLRSDAGVFASKGDYATALALWECVFALGQAQQNLAASDYMGLAEARLRPGDVAGAVELLRRMTLLPEGASVYANYDLAAALLESKGRNAEAEEFLTLLARGVPWKAEYQLRLAKARLHTGKGKAEAVTSLRSIASNSAVPYGVRVQALLLHEAGAGDAAGALGSEELRLLTSGKFATEQAQRPYFAAARIAAAEVDSAHRAVLLREAIGVAPEGFAAPAAFTGDAVRLSVFRAEVDAGHDATALAAMQSLIEGPVAESQQIEADSQAAISDAEDDASMGDGVAAGEIESDDAPCDGRSPLSARVALLVPAEADKLALIQTIATVYERSGRSGEAIPYLKKAVCLQKDNALKTALQSRIRKLETTLALEAQNAERRPEIRKALDQSRPVRPRLMSAADLAHGNTEKLERKEAQP